MYPISNSYLLSLTYFLIIFHFNKRYYLILIINSLVFIEYLKENHLKLRSLFLNKVTFEFELFLEGFFFTLAEEKEIKSLKKGI